MRLRTVFIRIVSAGLAWAACLGCQSSTAPVPAPTEVTAVQPAPPPSEESDREGVLRAYEAYRNALLRRDGKLALRFVDQKSLDLYEDFRQHALKLKKDQLQRLDLLDKLVVLRLRHEFTRKEIEAFSAADVLRIGVERGWTSAPLAEADQVVVEGVTARIAPKNTKGTFSVFLSKVKGEWRIELWKTLALIKPMARQLYERDANGASEEDYALQVLASLSHFRVDRAILDGPRER